MASAEVLRLRNLLAEAETRAEREKARADLSNAMLSLAVLRIADPAAIRDAIRTHLAVMDAS